MSAVIGYAPGAYDLFHVGHLNVLRHARRHCDVLVAGVVADEVCELTKGVRPFVPLAERLDIVASIGIVDQVHAETTPDKLDAWQDVRFHRIFKGDDWRGTPKGDALEERLGRGRRRGRLLPLHGAHLQHHAAPRGDGPRPAAPRRPGGRGAGVITLTGSRAPTVAVDDDGLSLPADSRRSRDSVVRRTLRVVVPAGPRRHAATAPADHRAGRRRCGRTCTAAPGSPLADHHRPDVRRPRRSCSAATEPAEAGQLRVEDAHGHPLAVNKVGNLTRVFAETDDGARARDPRGHRAGARRPARRRRRGGLPQLRLPARARSARAG